MVSTFLSAHGVERAAAMPEGDFVFIGTGCQLQCTKFQAAFISPRVHALLLEDATVVSLFIECEAQGINEKRVFDLLEHLIKGLPIDPRGSDVDGLFRVADFLGNRELLNLPLHDEGLLHASTVCSRLRKKSLAGRAVDAEVEFAASHFYEIEMAELKELEVALLERIVSSGALVLNSEDSLLDFICSLNLEAEVVLLRYLRIDNLSCQPIDLCLNRMRSPILDAAVWDSLCHRLRLAVRRRPPRPSQFPLTAPGSLDGIISYLTKKHNGNVDDTGIVRIISKSVISGLKTFAAKNVADLTSGSSFCSEHKPHEWLCWDFGDMRVCVTHYTIWSLFLTWWVLEGSMNGRVWEEIDRKSQCMAFKRGKASFQVENPRVFRFIRLTQADESDWGLNPLRLDGVEFFGTLVE